MAEYIESIWDEYDTNKSGVLEKKQAMRFLDDMVSNYAISNLSASDLEDAFYELDTDSTSSITK